MHGSVDPNGGGGDAAASSNTGRARATAPSSPCAPSAVGNGDAPVPVGVNLDGLLPGTTYHFRFGATNVGRHRLRRGPDAADPRRHLRHERRALPADRHRSKPEPTKCRKGQVRKKGRCVKKQRHHRKKQARSRRTGERRMTRRGSGAALPAWAATARRAARGAGRRAPPS